ncbi:TIGR03084 family metal-binding protein [Micromonospora sp. NBC_01699]|uniref:TIGR03084 family metal-binding protein n=1 Tax=Micromonospora sp. NBC_01699 TaxID=2975984 RepID=UPI002E2E724F|nr:TIGR03084 family metal-binding protein [Micromonospora sp. NBC_01699]
MVDLSQLLTDLTDESSELDALVAERPAVDWAEPTPAPGWTIAHQIAHLAWTDHVALLAATDVPAFYASLEDAAADPGGFADRGANEILDQVMAGAPDGPTDPRAAPAALLDRWRTGRAALAAALAAVPAGDRLPWYGTSLSPATMATARLMETWAHGQDVADTLGVTRTPSGRLRHVAHLGFRTLGHSFATHGRAAPDVPVRVELRAPDGTEWTFGTADAVDLVAGPALDFCLLVTQRRHRTDLSLVATGGVADEWLDIAQAFAGPPGPGREPRAGRDRAARRTAAGNHP